MSDGKRTGAEASRDQPCPICGQRSWCLLFTDGGVNCYRADGPGCLEKQDRQGQVYWVHPPAEERPKPTFQITETACATRADSNKLGRCYLELQGQLTLSAEHQTQLAARGLSEQAIRAYGFRSMSKAGSVRATIAQSLAEKFPFWAAVPGIYQNPSGRPQLAASSGLMIFGQNLQGQIISVQLRLDEVKGSDSRYRWMSSAKHGGPGPGAPATFWKPHSLQPVPGVVRICEGAFKAIVSAERTGIPAIAAGAGVGSMASKQVEEYLRELHPATVLFAPDQDTHKPEVARRVDTALGRLLWLRQEIGFELLVETWAGDLASADRPKGVDDALLAGFDLITVKPEVYRRQLPFVDDGQHLGQQGEPLEAPDTQPDWEKPVPLDAPAEKPSFPIEAFPSLARDYALALAEAYQVPVSYAGTLVLGVASTCSLKRMVVDTGRGDPTALNGWFLSSMESGSGKTTSMMTAFAPVFAYERDYLSRHQPAEDLPEGSASSVGVVSSEPTPEALEKLLNANDGRYAIANPEGGDFFACFQGRYSPSGSSSNLSVLLKSFSGEHHRTSRVGRGNTYIDEPRTTLTLAVQPCVYDGVCCSPELKNRGLLGRFLMDSPDSLLGRRKAEPRPLPKILRERWHSLVVYLLGIEAPRDDRNRFQPFPIFLDAKATAILKDFKKRSETELLPEGYWDGAREFGSRAAEHLIKLAGLLHILSNFETGKPWDYQIGESTITSAIQVFRYFAEHVRIASGSVVQNRKSARLEYLLDRIRSKPEWRESFRARDLLVLVKKRKGFETIEAVTEDLNQLCRLGYLHKTIVRRGRPSVVYLVSPWVHQQQNDPQNLQSQTNPFAVTLSDVSLGYTTTARTTHRSQATQGQEASFVGGEGDATVFSPSSEVAQPSRSNSIVGNVGKNSGFPVMADAPQFVDMPEMF